MLGFVEQLLDGFATRWKGTLTDWCDLETGYRDASYLITQTGGCVSTARIDGLTRLYSDAELPDVCVPLWPVVAGASDLHDIEFTYLRDPDRGRQVVAQALQRLARRAATAGIANLERLTQMWDVGRVAKEEMYVALWTHPRSLTRAERQRDSRNYAHRRHHGGDFRHTQDPFRAYAQLISTHTAAAEAFFQHIGNCHIALTPLSGPETLSALKRLINPHQSHWQPHLIGDPIAGSGDYPGVAALLWLDLRSQLFDLDEERQSRIITRIGDTYYASVQLTLLPQRIVRFSALRIDLDVPVRMRFLITRWPLWARFHYKLNRFLAGVMNWPGHERNNLVVQATQELQPLIEKGQTRILRVVATTWGDSAFALRVRFEKLISGLQHWGQCQVKPIKDDPVEGVMASLPSVFCGSAGAALIAPKQMTAILPVDRPVVVFREGLIFRTPQGQPWFYEPMGDEQAAWVTQISGPQGYGKTVLLAALNWVFLCRTGEIPYLGLIEIKPSAEGLFALLRELAEAEAKKLFLYRKLSHRVDDAINPFDTFLGCRRPLPPHREFLIRFLVNLSYSFDAAMAEKDTTELVTMLVDELYRQYLDDAHGNPKIYTRAVNDGVDERLDRHAIRPRTWFEAADRLFLAGEVEAAEVAHLHAMPLLQDAAILLKQSDRIREAFGKVCTRDGQPLIDYVHLQWIAALQMFPQLTAPTRVQIGAARVIGFDLEEVAPHGYSERERRVTTVAYLLARQLVARYVFLRPEHVAYFAPSYQDHARRVIMHAMATPKALSYDEAHIFKGIPAAESLLVYDARIARQYFWSLAFSTQLFHDIEPIMELTSTRFIVGTQTEETIDRIHDKFRLKEGEREALLYHIRAPTAQGSHLLAIVDTKRHGPVVQHVRFPAPPLFLWALATSRVDHLLKAEVLKRLSLLDALEALAGRFPTGSAKAHLESLLYEYPERTQPALINELANSVLAYHMESKHAAA